LPVIDRKGNEAQRLIERKASTQHCPHHPSAYATDTTNAERHCRENRILFSGIRVFAPS
jgi:hypothetical protein